MFLSIRRFYLQYSMSIIDTVVQKIKICRQFRDILHLKRKKISSVRECNANKFCISRKILLVSRYSCLAYEMKRNLASLAWLQIIIVVLQPVTIFKHRQLFSTRQSFLKTTRRLSIPVQVLVKTQSCQATFRVSMFAR